MAVAAAAFTIFSAVTGFVAQRKQKREMRRAAESAQEEERKQRAIANRQAAIERRRQIRMSIAQARVTRAQRINQSFGVGGSATAGSTSAVSTDVATTIGAANTQQAAQTGIAASQDRQAQALQAFQNAQGGNAWSDISQLSGAFGSAFTSFGGGNPFSGLFSGGGGVDTTTPLFGRAR